MWAPEDLINKIKNQPELFYNRVTRASKWGVSSSENMNFKAVVGNPPYQDIQATENCTVNRAFSSAVYPYFIDMAARLTKHYVSLITPSRWMTKTGQGIDESWVDEKINCNHFLLIHDYYMASQCFNNVEIKGGVNYFLYNSTFSGPCRLVIHAENDVSEITEELNAHGAGIVIRDTTATKIYKKVLSATPGLNFDNFSSFVSPQHFFDKSGLLTTSWKGFSLTKDDIHHIKYYLNKQVVENGFAWIKPSDIPKHEEVIPYHKVFLPKAYGAGETYPHQIIGKPFYGEPDSVCSQTYLVIGYDQSKKLLSEFECRNIVKYLSSRFLRFLVYIKKKTQDNPTSVFEFVPLQDFSSDGEIDWSKSVQEIDAQLYKKYHLSDDEIAFIESMIKPM